LEAERVGLLAAKVMVASEITVPAALVALTVLVVGPLIAVVGPPATLVRDTVVGLEASGDLPTTLAGLVPVTLIDLATLEKAISAGVAAPTLGAPGALKIQDPPVMAEDPVALALQISATSVASMIPSDEWSSSLLVQL
jgi:hypothetical protein